MQRLYHIATLDGGPRVGIYTALEMTNSAPDTPFDFQRSLKSVSSFSFIHKYLPVDRYVVRPPAALLVRAVFRTSLTPNQLTVCSFLFGLAGGVVYFGGTPLHFAWAGVLVMLSTIFDCADGMLARAKNVASRFGAFMDLFLDRITDFAVLVGMSFGYYFFVHDVRYLVFGLLTISLYFLQVSLYYIVNIYKGREKHGEAAEAKSLVVFIIFVGSFFGRLDVLLLLVFLLSFVSLIGRSVRFLGRWRDQADPRSR